MLVNPNVILALVVAVVLLILGLIIWVSARMDKKRSLQLMEAASQLGFESLPALPGELDGIAGSSKLMNTGRLRLSKNVFRRSVDPLDVVIYDFEYTVGSGKSQQTPRQTVALFRSPQLQSPKLHLQPEGWLSRVGEWFGRVDIDFEEAPEFSRQFTLSGTDEPAIREFFTSERLQVLTDLKGISLEASPGVLLIWYNAKRMAPADFAQFFERCFVVYSAFCNHAV